jgi:hypothetical protein
VKTLFTKLLDVKNALASLEKKAVSILSDPRNHTDPELNIRLALEGSGPSAVKSSSGAGINWLVKLSEAERKQLRREINSIEASAKRSVEEVALRELNPNRTKKMKQASLPDVDRVQVLEHLVMTVADRLDMYVKDQSGNKRPVMTSINGEPQQAKWPNGTLRYETHLDGEINRARDLYYGVTNLVHSIKDVSVDGALTIDQIGIVLTNQERTPEGKAKQAELLALVRNYYNTKLGLSGEPMSGAQMAMVARAIKEVGDKHPLLAELRDAHCFGALAAADTLKLTHLRRDIVTFAFDQHPMDTNLNPFDQRTYADPPAPEMSQKNGVFWVVPDTADRDTWSIYTIGREMGMGTNTIVEHAYGLSYEEMVIARRNLNFENAYIMCGNQPLPQSANNQTAIAKKFRLPILPSFPDPQRGNEPHDAILLGATIHSPGLGTGLLPGNTRPIYYNNDYTPMIDQSFTTLHQDEQTFIRGNRADYVKNLLHKAGLFLNKGQIDAAVDDLYQRRGRYNYPDKNKALADDAYIKHRERSVSMITAFDVAKAKQELEDNRPTAGPDRIADLEGKLADATRKAEQVKATASYDARAYVDGLLEFERSHRESGASKRGGSWLGLAGDLSGLKNPPYRLRFTSQEDLIQKLPRMARYGISMHPHLIFAD